MQKIVFILGAGASVHAGAPVMGNFIDRAETLYASKEVEDQAASFKAVFDGIQSLQAVFAKSHIDTRNLEAVFIAFEMAKLLNIPLCGGRDLPNDLRRLIVATLEKCIRYPIDSNRDIAPTVDYGQLASFVHRVARGRKHPIPGIITFNYDCALDYAFGFAGLPIAYHLTEASAPSEPHVDLLKLHGSVNWVEQKGSPDIRVSSISPRRYSGFPSHEARISMEISRECINKLADQIPCGIADLTPMIIPPTSSKAEHHVRLKSVWQRAAKLLSEAEAIVIAGYSLPVTDEFFKYLFALGTIGRTRLKAVFVADTAEGRALADLNKRLSRLFGPLAAERYVLGSVGFARLVTALGTDNPTDAIETMRNCITSARHLTAADVDRD